jgi:putative SOS response-associated peptidase YedK
MCGRFALFTAPTDIMNRFVYIDQLGNYNPNYNVSPGTDIPVLFREEKRLVLGAKRWGLVPSWAKDPTIGNKLINARAETITEKPSFRHNFRYRRCIIPADGFYEWRKGQPFYVRFKNKSPIFLAGVHDYWYDPNGNTLETCIIITTAANDKLSEIHDRMPVIITPENAEQWLSAETKSDLIAPLLIQTPSEMFDTFEADAPGEIILGC